MNKTKLILLLCSLVFGVGIIFFLLSPTATTKSNSARLTAFVSEVQENKKGDLTLTFRDKKGLFYFPKKNIQGMPGDSLIRILPDHEVTVYFVKPHFLSGLHPQAETKRVRELILDGKVLYSDF